MSRMIAFRLPDELTTAFYAKVGEQKTTTTAVVVELVRRWVDDEPSPTSILREYKAGDKTPPALHYPKNPPKVSTLATDAQIAACKAARNPVAASVPLITDVQRKPYQKTGKRK